MDDEQEHLLTRLNYAVFGVTGNNGIRGDLTNFRREFTAYVAAEAQRREDETKDKLRKDRALAIASISSVVGLIGIVATLLVVVVSQ